MEVLTLVLLGIVLSFIGSIPFGTINVTVIETAILNGLRVALWVILGAALIEFIQASVALVFSDLITRNPLTEQIIFWISIPIFIGLGIYYLRQKDSEKQAEEAQGYAGGKGFLKGVIVSSLNILAIPYWIFYGSYLSSVGWIDLSNRLHIAFFSTGVIIGTITILTIYARLGVYARTKYGKITRYIAPGVAGFFFLLAAIQIVRIFLKMQ